MSQKRVPGSGWAYMVYDNRNRLVMTQDSLQRYNNQWLVTKYDSVNRPVITALYSPGSSVSLTAMSSMISKTKFCEYYGGTPLASSHGYSNTVFPSANLTVLTVTYYDNYNFVTDLALGSSYNYLNSDVIGQETTNNARVIG